MKATVAICTWNRAALLDQTLDQMGHLRIPEGVEWELLIVDNNSTDDTDAVITKHATLLPIRKRFEPMQGKSYAANLILDEAKSDLILWTDDDVLVDENWLTAAIEVSRRYPQAAAFGGPIKPWFPTPPDPELVSAFPLLKQGMCGIDHEMDEGVLPSPKAIVGANMMFRVSRLRSLRFRTDLGPRPVTIGTADGKLQISMGGREETDYIHRLRSCGSEIVWAPGMKLQHYVDPRRTTVPYLTRGYLEAGRLMIREEGIPEGPVVFGVPRWILRQWADAWLRHLYYQLRGQRVDALSWIRERFLLQGMALGCRDLMKSSH